MEHKTQPQIEPYLANWGETLTLMEIMISVITNIMALGIMLGSWFILSGMGQVSTYALQSILSFIFATDIGIATMILIPKSINSILKATLYKIIGLVIAITIAWLTPIVLQIQPMESLWAFLKSIPQVLGSEFITTIVVITITRGILIMSAITLSKWNHRNTIKSGDQIYTIMD